MNLVRRDNVRLWSSRSENARRRPASIIETEELHARLLETAQQQQQQQQKQQPESTLTSISTAKTTTAAKLTSRANNSSKSSINSNNRKLADSLRLFLVSATKLKTSIGQKCSKLIKSLSGVGGSDSRSSGNINESTDKRTVAGSCRTPPPQKRQTTSSPKYASPAPPPPNAYFALRRRNSLIRLLHSIQYELHRKSGATTTTTTAKSKHVKFADSLGLDLTIQFQISANMEDSLIELSKLISKQSFADTYVSSVSSAASNKQTGGSNCYVCAAAGGPNDPKRATDQKTIVATFSLCPDANYEKLMQNGICLNSIDIYSQSCIRGIILTLTDTSSARSKVTRADRHQHQQHQQQRRRRRRRQPRLRSVANPRASDLTTTDNKAVIDDRKHRISDRLCRFIQRRLAMSVGGGGGSSATCVGVDFDINATDSDDSGSGDGDDEAAGLDLVYVIWSVNEWKSWKYQACVQNNCKSAAAAMNDANDGGGSGGVSAGDDDGCGVVIRTHEFFIQNVDTMLQLGQQLQLIVCHQTGSVVHRDTNDETCYNFECAIKI